MTPRGKLSHADRTRGLGPRASGVLASSALPLALALGLACGCGSGVTGASGNGSAGAGGRGAAGVPGSGGAATPVGPGTGGSSVSHADSGVGQGADASGGARLVAGTGGSLAGATGGAGGGGGNLAGAGGVPACPSAATFCSGFEEPGIPAGAVYKANAAPGDWTRDFELDATVHHSGRSSLRVKASSEAGISGAYRMLSVPSPGPAFWVRLFILQMDVDIGGLDHNVFGGASASDEPNDPVMVELAEDVGLAFNSHDAVRWPVGAGRTTAGGTNPFTLAKGTWHCLEISYDSQARHQQLFVDGTAQIDAADFPAAMTPAMAPFKVFKFGFDELHGPARKVWYDDVAVAAQRIPCL